MKRGLLGAALLCVAMAAQAEPPARQSALARMPVREITVFKDGHAFVLHQGKMPTDAAGNVEMDYLPTPVLGTFWPYSAEKNVTLVSVKASPRRLLVEHTSLTMPELIEANPGASVQITQSDGKTYTAEILRMPARSGEELEATLPPNSGERLPEKSGLVLLKTTEGAAVVGVDRIRDLIFKGPFKDKVATEEFRNLLTLQLAWPNNKPEKTVDVGMVYLQKGIRWIPNYRVKLDGKGTAAISLQGSLINEMTDLQDVTVNLVIGVPSFAFQETPDPISLQGAFAQLSPLFQTGSQTASAFSNAIASQSAYAGGRFRGGAEQPGAGGAPVDLPSGGKTEDMYIFTVKHISLKKGERMTLPIADYTLKYRDKYTLDFPYTPPREIRNSSPAQEEAMRLLNAPKVQHKICLTNDSKYPLTTAPALLLEGERVLAQGLMSYAGTGGNADLDLTAAVDIRVKKSDKETVRTPNAVKWQNEDYGRIDLAGAITLTNFLSEPVEVEVTRNVLGNVDKADKGGAATMVNQFEDDDYAPRPASPSWWGSYNWPAWWSHFNGVGRLFWTVKVPAGKSVDLGYTWHYFWR